MATEMITEPGPESWIKNRVDNKKMNWMLVDKKVSVEKQQQQQQKQIKSKTNKQKKLLVTKIAAAVAKWIWWPVFGIASIIKPQTLKVQISRKFYVQSEW